ncbi:MAG: type II toxin-antitoxin system HicA family toxin [Candidatus Yanofskybacteria bacterium]|nr:type II toxin-antitoxin system HicA family toxin [Candidatus Yanofskybacteria bacterium]
MVKIPALTAKKVIKVLKRIGFLEDRQKGSHLILFNSKTNTRTVVPVHAGKTLKKPLVRAIINDTKLTVKEFVELLK